MYSCEKTCWAADFSKEFSFSLLLIHNKYPPTRNRLVQPRLSFACRMGLFHSILFLILIAFLSQKSFTWNMHRILSSRISWTKTSCLPKHPLNSIPVEDDFTSSSSLGAESKSVPNIIKSWLPISNVVRNISSFALHRSSPLERYAFQRLVPHLIFGPYLTLTWRYLDANFARYMSLCCFHNEGSPSMSICDDMGYFKCFSCGAKGDLFQFIQRAEDLDFLSALRRAIRILSHLWQPSQTHFQT